MKREKRKGGVAPATEGICVWTFKGPRVRVRVRLGLGGGGNRDKSFINTTQHNTTLNEANKTRQYKTRHDTARTSQDKNCPPALPLPPLLPQAIPTKTLHTPHFSLQTFHKCPYSCLSSTDTFTCPVCALRENCDSAHTRHERLYPHLHPDVKT